MIFNDLSQINQQTKMNGQYFLLRLGLTLYPLTVYTKDWIDNMYIQFKIKSV